MLEKTTFRLGFFPKLETLSRLAVESNVSLTSSSVEGKERERESEREREGGRERESYRSFLVCYFCLFVLDPTAFLLTRLIEIEL